MPAYTGTLSAAQVNALFQGFTVLAQRVSEASNAAELPATGGSLTTPVANAMLAEMVGLQQPLATLTDAGQTLLEGLAQPLQALAVSAARTANEVKALIESALATAGTFDPATVVHSLETLADGRQVVWFEIPLAASTTLVDYTLDVGQSPSEDPSAPSLADQGLRLGTLEVDVEAGVSGTLRVGIDLSPGLATDQAVVFDLDGLRVCAEADTTVAGVQASFGVVDLGPADVAVALDLCVELDLIEGAGGYLPLGMLNSLAIDELFSFSLPHGGDAVPDLSVDIPFNLGIGGFNLPVDSALTLSLEALDGFDLGSLAFDFPELLVGSTAFDFAQLGEISIDDLGAWLGGVGDWLPQFGEGFTLPLVDLDLGAVLDLGSDWADLLDDLQDEHGAWQFNGILDLFGRIAGHFGLPATPAALQTTFALTWNPVAEALEWTVPYSASFSETVEFDSAGLLPADLPLNIQAEASATVSAALNLSITGGVAISSSAQVDPVTSTTLLTEINSGVGLTTQGLLPGADLRFTMRDGSTVNVDLNSITGLGTTGTVGGLLTALNAASPTKLSAAITDSRLVLTDLTSGPGTFSVASVSATVTTTSSATGATINTESTSVAPLVLGLWGVAAQPDSLGRPQITGHSLESLSLADRLYIKEQDSSDPLLSGTVTIDATLDGGAAIGPVSLQVVEGQAHGQAQWALTLNDPATGADDGRIYLSELADANLADVLDHGFTVAPTLDGIFQLAVTPELLNAGLGIDANHYSTDPLNLEPGNPDVAPVSAEVPYLDLSAGLVDGQWSFSVEPSIKLEEILSGNFADFSWDDLPDLLSFMLAELEGSDLWNLPIPLAGVTLGDLFGFAQTVAEFSLPDLALELADLGTWRTDFAADLEAALPELQALDLALPALDLDLAGRLQQIQWEFNRIDLAWDGRSGGDSDFDLDFMTRLGAWSAHLAVFLGDLDLAFDTAHPGGSGLAPDLSALNLTLDGLVDWLDDIPFGLDGLSQLLEGLFLEADGTTPKIPGLTLNVDVPSIDFGTAPRLVFDLDFTLDPATFSHDIDLGGMDLGGGSVLDITSGGTISLALGGSFSTRIGFDFGTMTPVFDIADTSAALTLGIVTSGPAQLGASLGGLAGVSIGKVDGSINDPFSITLTETDPTTAGTGYDPATDPATITFNGALAEGSRLGGAAHFHADLPLYVDALGTSTDVGNVVITAEFNANPLSFDADIDTSSIDLENLFSIGDLDLSGWLDGALAFVDGLITVLESDLIGGLPVIADLDLAAEGGFLKELRDVLVTLTGMDELGEIYLALDTAFDAIAATPALAAALSGSFTFRIGDIALNPDDIGVPGSDHNEYWNTDVGELFTGAAFSDENFENLVIEFNVGGLFQDTLDGSELDLGLDDLGIAIDTTGGIDLVADFDLRVGFGYSPTAGFFVQGTTHSSGKELEASVGVGFSPGSSLELDIGPLNFALTDLTPGEIVASDGADADAIQEAIDNRELHAAIAVDLGSGMLASTSGGLLSGTGVTVTAEAKAKLDLDLASNLGVGLEMSTGYYADDGGAVDLAWNSSTGLSIGDGSFHFEITDTYIDLGKLLGPAFVEMVQRIDEAFEPLDPILDILTGEVPLVSDVSKAVGGGPVTVLDAISWFGEGAQSAVEFIQFLDTVLTVTDSLADSGKFYLGGLLAPASTGPSGLGSVLSGSSAHTAGTVPSDDVPAAEGPSSSNPSIFSNSLGLSFPLLQNPGEQLFNFLFGGEADLVVWDIPDLAASFDFRQSFPIFPPLYVSLFGGVEFNTNFDLGYDTRGLRMAMESGDLLDLLNGVYLLDEGREGYELGADDPEMSVTAEIGAGAELNVVVAKAGVDGGVRGTVGADLNDPDPDGKVYVDELAYNLMRGPQCIFDLEGSLSLFLEAYIKVGLDTPFGFVTLFSERFKLAEATLLDWSMVVCPPVEPDLAELASGTLTLNMGSRAGLVVPGETEDGDEVFTVDYVANGTDMDGNAISNVIRVTAYNFEEYFAAGSVTKIVFDAGIGNDTVLIAPGVNKAVEGRGGDGDDNLVGGSGTNKLWGDAGSDVLAGRAGNDTLDGGAGDDFLYGYGGADSIVGGAGDDELFGEDDVGDLVDFIAANPDYNAGTAGNDTIWGGDSVPSSTADGDDRIVAGSGDDRVDAGAGDDAVSAGAGNDTVEGKEGNDQIHGGDGNDKLWGDDSAGLVDGGSADTHADKIEGGAGYNEIDGGTGDDLLYAVDEDQLAAAPQPTLVGGWASKVWGGDGADMIYGTAGKDSLSGGFESDYIESGAGNDLLLGGPGSDALLAGGGNATVYGGHGNDVIDGGNGVNWIEGGPGDDQIYAREGADTVYGGTTARGYVFLLDDLSGDRAVIDPLHGGFRSTLAEDSCGPEIFFYPEVYEGPLKPLVFTLFNDADRDGVRDSGEGPLPSTTNWSYSLYEVTSEGSALVHEGTASGGTLTLPDSGVPGGTYQLVVMPGAGTEAWMALSFEAMGTEVTLTDGVQTGRADLPWVAVTGREDGGNSDIRGQVLTHDRKDDPEPTPTRGAVVYIDADKDGAWDAATEDFVLTNANGVYVFAGMPAGDYVIGVDVDGVCATPFPRSKAVETDGINDAIANFMLVLNTAPVVAEVELGLTDKQTQARIWRPVDDGNEQMNPIVPPNPVTHIAIDLCGDLIFGEKDRPTPEALLTVDGRTLALSLAAFSDTADHTRFEFLIPNATDGLPPGLYTLQLKSGSVKDAQGDALDGEWRYPQAYASGDGTPGGDFVFDFKIGSADGGTMAPRMMSFTAEPSGDGGTLAFAMVATAPPSTLTVGDSRTVLQGAVWMHDARSSDLAQGLTEAGLPGQGLEVRSERGDLVARLTSGPVDLDGDGSIGLHEQGGFRVSGLLPGTYTVTQVTAEPWEQVAAVATSPGPDRWLSVLWKPQEAASTLSLIEHGGAGPQVVKATRLDGVLARDVTWLGADRAVVVGMDAKSAGPALFFVQMLPDDSAKVVQTLVLPEALRKPTLVGVDSVDNQYLLVTAADGSLLRYALAADTWTDLGDLQSPTGAALYPVGDIAVVSPQQAWLIASDTPVDPVEPYQAKQQFLVRLDPLTASVQSVRPIGSLERTAPLLIGLDVDEGGALTALNQLGDFVAIDATSATVTGTRAVAGLPRNAGSGGGLSVLDGEDRTETRPGDDGVTITVGQDGKVEVGFGDQPTRHDWLDGDDTIDGGCGTAADVLHGDDYLGSDPALQLPSNLILIGGNDEIRGRDGNDTLDGGLQGDVLRGEAGNDRLLGGDTEANRIEGGDGDDSIDGGAAGDHILGGAGNDSVAAGGGNDWVFGEAGRDSISGGDGHDVLVGGADEDTVRGDAGNDTLVVVNGDLGSAYTAVPTGTGGGSYDGGADSDQLVAVRSHESAVADITLTAGSVQLGSAPVETVLGVESALLAGGSAGDTISAATFGGTTVIYGHGGNDTLTGSAQGDLIYGGSGFDLVKAGGGDDRIWGGSNSNTIHGGPGNDLIVLDPAANDLVVEAAGAGSDTVDGSAAIVDTTVAATAVEVTAGSSTGFGFVLQGEVERLLLGSGDDRVGLEHALASALAVDAGPGEDMLDYSAWSTGVTVELGAGTASGLGGIAQFENVQGGDGNDSLTGNGDRNVLAGGAGKDTLRGGSGDDLLYGEAGNDSLLGGSGDDLLDAGDGYNVSKGGTGNDTYAFLANAQTDQVSEVSGEGSDHLDFGYVTSGALLFALKTSGLLEVSGAGITVQAQTLAALDSVTGGSGADRFVFDDGASIGGILDGGGVSSLDLADQNTLDYSAYTTPVTVDLSGMLSAASVCPATGTAGVMGMRHVIGGASSDVLTGGGFFDLWLEGGAGADLLLGASGNDLLSGGGDGDSITGGAGDDTLDGGSGLDTLSGGDDDDVLQGGADKDTLYGDKGNDALDGGAGNDYLSGGDGDDTLVGGQGDDTVNGWAGVDVARFVGPRSAYTVTSLGSSLQLVSVAEGTDRVSNVERFEFADGAYTAAALLATPGTVDIDATVYTWKTHTLLQGTTVSMDSGAPVTADVYGVAALGPTSAPSVDLKASRSATAADQASVTLADAVSILKMIAGLPVNPPGQALSPYQSIAADADGNGSVTLADALGVLRHAVGLPAAATPKWVFVDEADLGMPARTGTTPGTVSTVVSTPAADHVGLVGILRGDVDGSWTPPVGAKDLDDIDGTYFQDLVATLNAAPGPDVSLSQWGIYTP